MKAHFQPLSSKDKEKTSTICTLHELPEEELLELAVPMACIANHMQPFAIMYAQSRKPGVVLQNSAYWSELQW